MSLTFYYHPLSSFCWKALIGLYEGGVAFEPHLLDLGDPQVRADFARLWPLGKMPVLHDTARGETVPEAGAIIEYLDLHYVGADRLIPAEPELAFRVRLLERIIDNYLHLNMQRIVGENLRPADAKDPFGLAQARAQLRVAYGALQDRLGDGPWAVGDDFTLADCAACPALYYADKVEPLGDGWPRLSAYLDRLKARPSFARALAEAEPYFAMFPG